MNDLIRRDIRRLVDATAGRSKGSSIAYGLLAFYTSRSASSKPDLINNMAEKVLEYAQEQIQRRSLEATATVTIQPLLNTTDLGSCAAGCLCIRALRRRT
jgi:hypothetical protein